MIEINDKSKCCGCTACINVCPQKCIKMVEDEEGFKYPQVDKSKCTNCGLCERICPVLNTKINEENINQSYCIRSKEKDILLNSTSGGFFTSLANYVLDNDGIVIGVSLEEGIVKHIIVDSNTRNNLEKTRGSKYVQSDLSFIYSSVKEYLQKGKMVCFSGTPCQVNGLLKFVMKPYDNLITVDVICHGVSSPKLLEEYIKYQELKHKRKIKNIIFRNKTYGYHSGTMKVTFDSSKEYYGSARTDLMLKSFFSEISSRPSCYNCAFKSDNHPSDFTIFDCWHASDLVEGLKDDDKGYTNLFVNTSKGIKIFENISNKYEVYEIDKEKAINLDGIMVRNSAKSHENRSDFYDEVNKYGLEKAVNKYIPISKKDYLVEKVKGLLYKTKILNIIKKILKKG